VPTEIKIDPINDFQIEVLKSTYRHQCGSGGYGNGKTYVFCAKTIILCATFPKYRVAILRRSSTDLSKTTRSTFFKICPPALYNDGKGGDRADYRNYLRLINGSEIFWMHLDTYDENVVRGLEINSAFVDQAEEIDENIYDHLDARIGRWDEAEIPPHLNPDDFPKNDATGKPMPPAYMMIACNPDSYQHWIYRKYHPESHEYRKVRRDKYDRKFSFADTHKMYQAASTDNPALDGEIIDTLLSRDEAFVRRFVEGKWGISEGSIHTVYDDSIIVDPDPQWLKGILEKATLYRILDHGSSSPTCCLWIAAYKNWYLAYREYYQAGLIVSDHRRAITQMSRQFGTNVAERYNGEYADPSIFKKTQEKYGGFWAVSDEYTDVNHDAPAIHWEPADNNEFMTRNRVSEVLRLNPSIEHILTGKSPAPKLYFLKKTESYPEGVEHLIRETQSQKLKQLGTENGKPFFSEDRVKHIPDHAYDCARYFFGTRARYAASSDTVVMDGTFLGERKRVRRNNYIQKQRPSRMRYDKFYKKDGRYNW
jgi:hypothetical protein